MDRSVDWLTAWPHAGCAVFFVLLDHSTHSFFTHSLLHSLTFHSLTFHSLFTHSLTHSLLYLLAFNSEREQPGRSILLILHDFMVSPTFGISSKYMNSEFSSSLFDSSYVYFPLQKPWPWTAGNELHNHAYGTATATSVTVRSRGIHSRRQYHCWSTGRWWI